MTDISKEAVIDLADTIQGNAGFAFIKSHIPKAAKTLRAQAARLQELEAMQGVVKPLEWERISSCVWRAETPFNYFAEVKCHRSVPDNFYVSSQVIDPEYAEDKPDLQSAFDAAQADYERRILSACTTPPADAIAEAVKAEQEKFQPLIDFFDVHQLDGATDDPDRPDGESVGWFGDGSDMSMTYGHIRRAAAAIRARITT